MGRQFKIGNPPIAVELRRSKRAKRLSLRVSRLDGRVTLTMPDRAPEAEGLSFVQEREDWLRKHLSDVTEIAVPRLGGTVLYRGEEMPIIAAPVRRAIFRDGALAVPDDPDAVASRVKAFLRLRARDVLAAASDKYAAEVDRNYTRLSLRDTRSRWGSCSSKGVLMYSWRLIMAPPEVLDYVAAHEVAHLVEMNHSQAFWDVVAGLMPDYDTHRKWLRTHGNQLHRISFPD